MFFNNKLNDEDREKIREYEEYQKRQEDIKFVRTGGNFLYKYLMYGLVYFATYTAISYGLIHFFGVGFGTALISSMLVAFFVFKIRYVRDYPFKSLLTLIFIMFLEALMLGRTVEFF